MRRRPAAERILKPGGLTMRIALLLLLAASLPGAQGTTTVQVTTTNISLVGKLIDTGNSAGANSINGPSYGLQNPEPETQLALAAASKQALAHAGAIASGLGAKTGAVISAQEASTITPILN